MADGAGIGVTGTPAFLLGKTVPGSPTVKVDVFIAGAKAYASFKQEFDQLLARPGE